MHSYALHAKGNLTQNARGATIGPQMPRKRDKQAADFSRRIHEEFGRRLAQSRAGRSLLQQDLGNSMGLSRTSVSNIECGTRAVFLDQVYQAAKAVGVDVRELLPSMEEVFPSVVVHAVHDDQVSVEFATKALQLVQDRLDRPPKTHKRRRAR